MQFIIPFCRKDAWLAEKLCAWIGELGGLDGRHHCLLLAAKATPSDLRIRILEQARRSLFCKVEMFETATSNEKGWPESCNHLFYCAAARMKKTGHPFLWLEPDCVPLRKTWLDELAAEYEKRKLPYLGFVWDKPWRHLTGCAIYPADIAAYNAQSLVPHRNPKGALPWDVVRAELTLKHTHVSKLIHHEWGQDDAPPAFPTQKEVDEIPKEAVLFHRSKKGDLIDRLRERMPQQKPKTASTGFTSGIIQAAKTLVRPFRSIPKVDLLYICVRSPSEPNVPRNFRESHERFVRTYKQFKPTIPHRLLVVCYNGERDAETDELFAGLRPDYTYYNGSGFDIGTYLEVGRAQDSDFILCCGSNVHFWKPGWLERIVEAWQKHGDGAYGPMASYESSPHIRTCCVGTTPKLLRKYPHTIRSRSESYMFESGQWNFTRWIQSQGLPALMVMADGELEQPDWRKPDNCFRRGDQSDCLIWDRHTRVYFDSNPQDRAFQERMANGGRERYSAGLSGPRKRYETITVVAATSLNAAGHAKAIDWTVKQIPRPCERLLIAAEKVPWFTGRQEPLPSPWAKNGKWQVEDMAEFLLEGLHKYINTDVAIIVHDDGYALNKSKWSDDFLLYDYVGAPWPNRFSFVKNGCRVGNGGFSLRSKQWLERAAMLPKLPRGTSEDVYTSILREDHFVHAGNVIAPLEVAMRWSFEHPVEEFPNWKLPDSFGFHGRTKDLPERKHLKLK